MIIDLNIQCQAMPINTTDLERQEKMETTQLITYHNNSLQGR